MCEVTETEESIRPVRPVIVLVEGSKRPHLGLLFPGITWQEIKAQRPVIDGVCPWARKFLGKHRNEQEWDFREVIAEEEGDGMIVLLIPLRYGLLCWTKILAIRLRRSPSMAKEN